MSDEFGCHCELAPGEKTKIEIKDLGDAERHIHAVYDWLKSKESFSINYMSNEMLVPLAYLMTCAAVDIDALQNNPCDTRRLANVIEGLPEMVSDAITERQMDSAEIAMNAAAEDANEYDPHKLL